MKTNWENLSNICKWRLEKTGKSIVSVCCPHSRLMLFNTSSLFSSILSAVLSLAAHSTQSNMLSERLKSVMRDSAPALQTIPLPIAGRGYRTSPGMTVTHSCFTGCWALSSPRRWQTDMSFHVMFLGGGALGMFWSMFSPGLHYIHLLSFNSKILHLLSRLVFYFMILHYN